MVSSDIFSHLNEMRQRLLRVVIVFVLCFIALMPSGSVLLEIIIAPAGQLIFTAPADALSAQLFVLSLGAFLMSFPLLIFEFWSFISAGLKGKEVRVTLVYGIISLVLFVLGAAFAWWVFIPAAWEFLLLFATPHLVPMVTVSAYLAFVSGSLMAFGLVFQIPLILRGLVRFGVVQAYVFRRGRAYALLIFLVIAAFLTPPDVVSQLILASAMMLLYEVGLWLL